MEEHGSHSFGKAAPLQNHAGDVLVIAEAFGEQAMQPARALACGSCNVGSVGQTVAVGEDVLSCFFKALVHIPMKLRNVLRLQVMPQSVCCPQEGG